MVCLQGVYALTFACLVQIGLAATKGTCAHGDSGDPILE